MKGALAGVRVVDMTSVVFGPYAASLLADLGADVIKVEAPGGDAFRSSMRANVSKGMSPGFMAFNRGKRAVTLDIKTGDGLAAVKALVAGCDLFMHNVRARAVRKVGLDYDSLRRDELVYLHCTGFAQDGPHADLPAYDDVVQALSGACSLLPRADGDPRPRFLPSLIADKVAGLTAAYAACAALRARAVTGRGQFVEVPLFESFANFLLSEHLGGLSFDPPNAPAGYPRQLDPARQPYPCRDGHVTLVVYTDAAMLKLFDLLGDAAFLAHPDFATPKARARNMGAIHRRIAELTPAFAAAELRERLNAMDIPCQAVVDLDDVLAEPALQGMFTVRDHPSEGRWRELRPAARFAEGAGEPPHPPLPDEQGDTIRAALREGRSPWREG